MGIRGFIKLFSLLFDICHNRFQNSELSAWLWTLERGNMRAPRRHCLPPRLLPKPKDTIRESLTAVAARASNTIRSTSFSVYRGEKKPQRDKAAFPQITQLTGWWSRSGNQIFWRSRSPLRGHSAALQPEFGPQRGVHSDLQSLCPQPHLDSLIEGRAGCKHLPKYCGTAWEETHSMWQCTREGGRAIPKVPFGVLPNDKEKGQAGGHSEHSRGSLTIPWLPIASSIKWKE